MIIRLGKKLLLFISLIFISLLIVLCLPVHDDNHYLMASIDKHDLLSGTPSPRIIIVGGSNTIFNFDSYQIEKEIGLPVINMGLHAGIGLRYELSEIVDQLQDGDIVIIIPEYAQFFKNNLEGGRILIRLITLNPGSIRYLSSWRQVLAMFRDMGLETRSKLMSMLGFYDRTEIYRRDEFNSKGDLTSHLESDFSGENLAMQAYEMRSLDNFNAQSIEIINNFVNQASLNGAAVLFAFPAIPEVNYYDNKMNIEQLYTRLESELKSEIILKPQESIFSLLKFYDTLYHLNGDGRQIMTERILRKLNDKYH